MWASTAASCAAPVCSVDFFSAATWAADARLVRREFVDGLERVLLVDDGGLDVLAGGLVGVGQRLRRGRVHLGQAARQLVADPLRAVPAVSLAIFTAMSSSAFAMV